jgi:uncharacterized protein YjbI with pentapeptide repeats
MLEQFKELLSGLKQVKLLTWIGLAIATVFLIVIGAWLSSWSFRVVQDWANLQQNPTDATKKQFDASLEIVKAIVGSLGTLATIIGGIILYLNFRVANQNAETAIRTVEVANQNAAIANKTVELTESRLITERFSKAIEQLGSDKLEVRLGGIYSLERIAKDSERDHWTIMEVLTAFVREKSPVERPQSKAKESFVQHWLQQRQMEKPSLSPVTKDVQAALTVIGLRDEEKDQGKSLDLSFSNLTLANLNKAKFNRAFLIGANFGRANLNSAIFSEAFLHGASFSEAFLDSANFADAKLSDADLSRAYLNSAIFSAADLSRANLSSTDLIDAKLNNARIGFADLSDANLNDADLSNANLISANLSESSLIDAKLDGARLDSTFFTDTDLRNAKGLTKEQLKRARLCNTTMPDGTISDRNCEALGITKE